MHRHVLALVLLATGPTMARAQGLTDSPIRVYLVPIVTGLTCPIQMVVAPGQSDRTYLVDQRGLVLVVRNRAVQQVPFMDIRGVVNELAPNGLDPGYDERGLLSLAFHPDYARADRPGYRTLYTLHNVPVTRVADFPAPPYPQRGIDINCQEVIAEWKLDARLRDRVNPNTYREVMRWDKPQLNHNGGTLLFGPDGLLYASIGDGGNGGDSGPGHNPKTGNAQDLRTILGKVIRINPLAPALTTARAGAVGANRRYRIPSDNPFAQRAGVVREVFAYGLRNPFRMNFDDPTGRLIVADVGQNAVEEVDVIVKGGNYGWPIKEGRQAYRPSAGNINDPRLINPVVSYAHDLLEPPLLATIGGFVYRGNTIPALQGKYVFGDLSGRLLVADLKTGKLQQLADPNLFIKGIGQDANRELYVLESSQIGPSGTGGVVLAIRPRQ
jgi:hypothetical protein